MDKNTIRKINQFVSSAANQIPGLTGAYLFGSYAKNVQNPDSDIDIALIIDDLKETDKFDMQVKLLLLAAHIDSRIEPHPLSGADLQSVDPFVHEIKKTGREIPVGSGHKNAR